MSMKQENAESYRTYSRNRRGKGKLVLKFQIGIKILQTNNFDSF